MTDIVERLRAIDHMSIEDCFLQSPLFLHAAAEIERLRLSLSEARATGRREGMEVSARIAALHNKYAAAAIRAAMEKEE
jgi:hypothetical protein